MKKFISLMTVIAITICSLISLMPVNAAAAETEYYLDGIGTSSLQHFSFYYTTAGENDDPTANMTQLSVVSNKTVANGCWPFGFDNKLKSYVDPAWSGNGPDADGTSLVYFSDAQYLFVYPFHDKAGNYYRPIIVFTAPVEGSYNISFGGSVGWSPDALVVDAWLNSEKLDGSSYTFTTVQGPNNLGDPGVIKDYSFDVELKAGEQLCLVFNYPNTGNRGNIENLTATLTSAANPDNGGDNNNDNGNNNTGDNNTGNNAGNDNTGNQNSGGSYNGTIEVEADVTIYAVITVASLAVALISLIALIVVVKKKN